MCGILAVIGSHDPQLAEKMSQKLDHRGPDEHGVVTTAYGATLCHRRLSIVDLSSGKQPIAGPQESYVIHNGEIYNHQEIRKRYPEQFKTKSDSEAILHAYLEKGVDSIYDLDGVFAFILVSKEKVFVGRDPIGVKPLFYGYDEQGAMWFASEKKALIEVCEEVLIFPPGTYYCSEQGWKKYWNPTWATQKHPLGTSKHLKDSLIKAVQKRLMSDVPLGVLLSGGLDSSLIASIVAREMRKQGQTVKSFSIGVGKDSKDLKAAREVAKFIGSEHHEILFTPEEGIEALRDVIHMTETYDVTSVRASTPMLLMSRYIRQQGVKVVLSGEGADEIFGGYLYFHKAPDAVEFHEECVRRVDLLHTSDVLRADRATMAEAVEARVPFLDKDFLQVAMSLNPSLKQVLPGVRMEKYALRAAFDDREDPFLPESILWRQKEQFSDGVGYSWIDSLKEYAESQVSDQEYAKRSYLFPHNTPLSKEAFFYRKIYSELFVHQQCAQLVKKWIPKWQEYNEDPSGRANAFHQSSYHQRKTAEYTA